MSGLSQSKWDEYRRNHVRLAEAEIQKLTADNRPPTTVVFPESPMNFMYEDDPETKAFINGFAAKNNCLGAVQFGRARQRRKASFTTPAGYGLA
jgi:apolipoprotein N-acyltransferase